MNMSHKLPLSDRIALWVTDKLGTMTCALIFCVIALVSLPAVLATRSIVNFIQWLSGAFIQLVALAILGAGQKLQSKHSERLEERIYEMERRHGEQLDDIIRLLEE